MPDLRLRQEASACRQTPTCAKWRSSRTATTRNVVLPLAACSSLIAGTPSHAEANPVPVVTGSDGSATLDQVVGRGVILPMERGVEGKSFRFQMPRGAKQGPNVWYTVRLEVTTRFAPDSGDGSILVSSATNEEAVAQIEFYSEHGSNGRAFTDWDSVDVFNGNRGARVEGRNATVKYENVLQFSEVKPGPNVFEFRSGDLWRR